MQARSPRTSFFRGRAGFTLVEMLLVLSIIGILSALALPPISRYLHQARVTATVADLETFGSIWATSGRQSGGDPVVGDFVGLCPALLTTLEAQQLLGASAPGKDHFGNPLEYRADQYPDPTMLLIRSANADGVFESDYVFGTEVGANDRSADIVWFETGFAQRPR